MILAIVLIISCALWIFLTSMPISDCMFTGRVETWIDQNGDSFRDESEPPLPDVAVTLTYREASSIRTTDVSGVTGYAFMVPCGDKKGFTLSATVPDGYQPTTDIEIKLKPRDFGQTYYFGFVPDSPELQPDS